MEGGRELTGPMITELARQGDPVARAALEVVGRALGVGIANLVNIFCPQVVVIGGGVSAAGDLLLDPAREVMRRRALRPGADEVRVEAAAFGAEAGMVGAALLAREWPDDVPSSAGPASTGAE
jgi:glucokinase